MTTRFLETPRELPVFSSDVVVAGGGTAGVVAALAAARNGARTILIESKGYTGGIAVEGGTALHSFYNLWQAFEVEKRQLVRGIPSEIVDRLVAVGGSTGHAEMLANFGYDSVCTGIDTELYKLVTLEMLEEAGVDCWLNTMLVDAIREGDRIRGVITESRSGREVVMAKSFVDCTGYGDLCGRAGASFTEPNDHPVANSIGVGNVSMEGYWDFVSSHQATYDLARGWRSGQENQIVRMSGHLARMPEDFRREAQRIGMAMVTTTVHDNYFMFLKLNFKMKVSPTSRAAISAAELELRRRQFAAVAMFRKLVPGCGKAFIARTSPSLCIRRGRCIECDYDITHDDVISGRNFEDDVFTYGFHDCAPRIQIANGGSYGTPYRALRVRGIENLLATGMMITSDWRTHMSTRNTVSCMGHGQAAGTAAALCAMRGQGTRELPYRELRGALEKGGVYLEN
ncbi:MAG: FAD-dependent oxidoreductase [Opitutaceae bacterium]